MNQECTIHTTDTPSLPLVECAPWCEDGDGHPKAVFPGDQYCISEGLTVQLLRMDLLEGYTPGSWMLDWLTAYAVRERFETEGTVQVSHCDLAAITLTPNEARQHAAHLLKLADLAEGSSA